MSSNTSVRCTTSAGGDGEVAADREGAGVDRRRHAAVVAHVVGQVPHAVEQAAAPGLDRLGQRARVAEEGVGRCGRLGEQRHREAGPLAALRVELDLVDDVEQRPGPRRGRPAGAPVDGVRRATPGWAKRLSPGSGGDVAAPDEHFEEIAAASSVVRGHDAGLDGDPLAQPTQRGGHLPAVEADERVGAEHDRDRSASKTRVAGRAVLGG